MLPHVFLFLGYLCIHSQQWFSGFPVEAGAAASNCGLRI